MNSAQRKLTWFSYFIKVLNQKLESKCIPEIYTFNELFKLLYLGCCESCVYFDSLIVLEELRDETPEKSRLFLGKYSFGGTVCDCYDIIPGLAFSWEEKRNYKRERPWNKDEIELFEKSQITSILEKVVDELIGTLGSRISDKDYIKTLCDILTYELSRDIRAREFDKYYIRQAVFTMWKYVINREEFNNMVKGYYE